MTAIFVSDASAEADRLSDVLRLRGHAVVDVPLSLLVARVAVQRPALVLIDMDAEGATTTVARLRSLPGAEDIPLVLLGTRERIQAEDPEALRRQGSLAFARPVDPNALVSQIDQLVSRLAPAPEPGPPSAPMSDRSSRSARTHSPPALDWPNTSRLSPELEALLRQAEERLETEQRTSLSSPLPTPEEEVEAVLPAEVLAALDEPLSDDDDDFSQAGDDDGLPRKGSGTTGAGRSWTGPGRDSAAKRGASTPEALASIARHAPLPDPSSFGPRVLSESRTQSDPVRPTFGPRPVGAHELVTPKPPPPPVTRAVPPPTARSEANEVAPLPPLAPVSASLARTAGAVSAASLPPRAPDSDEPAPPSSPLPQVFGEGDAPGALATAIAGRATGSLCFEAPEGIRRIVLRDGDLVTAASGIDDESLLAFLVARGDLPKATAKQLRGKLPAFGRRAGAALIAYGHLEQDQLWPVLRAHAEWIVACALVAERATMTLETELPERLRSEPSVFGGATGAEVFVEVARRVIPVDTAIAKLGGTGARVLDGPRPFLLTECALPEAEAAAIARGKGATVAEVAAHAPSPELPTVLYVLVLLGVLSAMPAAARAASAERAPADPLDAEALRTRVRARMELVQEGDYFAVLGVPRNATAYEIRRAYLELRRAFEPARVLTAQTADLADDMRLITEVLDEAYEILRDATRRERYRRAIEAGPP